MKHLMTLKLIDAVAKSHSIRKAAEDMALTPSALHRRIQAFEEELGQPIFERLAHGVRLNAAGEMVIQQIRSQLAETERLRSRLADLAGLRRGHVAIACSQALTPYFLPSEIAAYRRAFPAVSFDVKVLDHLAAELALVDYSADIALVFDSNQMSEFQATMAIRQDIMAVMAEDHPLAAHDVLRLRQCLAFPLALPTPAFGGRQLLEKSIARSSLKLEPAVESNSFEFLKRYVVNEQAISFQIPIGAPDGALSDGLTSRPLDRRDVEGGFLYLGQRRGRTLPVASARFADQIARSLADRFEVI